ncbi:alpha/beta hydrolase [bacterium SCSIO 12696]|nr:alpha/beta hydrolase [bacterium SCSIO 12696]
MSIGKFSRLFLASIFLTLSACTGFMDYPSAVFTVADDKLVLNGIIDDTTPDAFRNALSESPNVTALVLRFVPGSIDDESNLAVARAVRNAGLTTEVPSGGIVVSGGTDLFLAGKQRRLGQGSCVGVHTWAEGLSGKAGAEYPRTSSEHQPYLDYYRDMAIDTEFYWFTLDAAGPEETHWMSRTEVDRFGMDTLGTGREAPLSSVDDCESRFSELWLELNSEG